MFLLLMTRLFEEQHLEKLFKWPEKAAPERFTLHPAHLPSGKKECRNDNQRCFFKYGFILDTPTCMVLICPREKNLLPMDEQKNRSHLKLGRIWSFFR